MTLFCSHQHELGDVTGQGRSPMASSRQSFAKPLRVLARRAGATFKVLHRAIVTAKIRRIERELMFHPGAEAHSSECQGQDKAAARFPQRPLILGDKWDF